MNTQLVQSSGFRVQGSGFKVQSKNAFCLIVYSLLLSLISMPVTSQSLKKISQDELRDKISGYWIAQCVGNYMGFPFEGTYLEDPVPVFVDRYYQFDDDTSLAINRNDLRGYCLLITNWYQIDPQLVNEIWSMFYPGMIRESAERAEWGTRITNTKKEIMRHPYQMFHHSLTGYC